jgi:hypothetical protein
LQVSQHLVSLPKRGSWNGCYWLIDWLHKGTGPRGPDAPKPYKRAHCAPYRNRGSPVALPKLQMAPRPIFLISSGSRKKEPRYIRLSEAQSHLQVSYYISNSLVKVRIPSVIFSLLSLLDEILLLKLSFQLSSEVWCNI